MAKARKEIRSMSSPKLIALAILALVTAGAIVFLLTWSQRPEYGVLFAGLDPEDAGAIIAKLGDKGVPYRLDSGIIYVPEDKVYETRMELAEEGLPGGSGVGFELFDKNNFGLTDFVQRINYRRAMQGELARSITEIRGVRSARVHLVIPEKGVFLDEEKKARASIVLKLRPGAVLGPVEVKAIVHLVAGSLQNLDPADVTIVDTEGRLWTADTTEDGAVGMLATDMEYKKKMEAGLSARVQSMLEKALGRGKAVARVTVDLERRRVQRREEIFDPDSQVVRSEERTKESAALAGAGKGGVPGTLSNLPGAGGGPSKEGGKGNISSKENEVINYEINKVVKSVVEPYGQVKKLSVAVLVDGSYEEEGGEGVKGKPGKKTYKPRTEEELQKITSMVKASLGFDEKRGDTISVVNIPFAEDLPFGEEATPATGTSLVTRLMPLGIKYGTVGLSVIFMVFFVLRPIIKRLSVERAALESIEKTLPAMLEGDGKSEDAERPRGALESGRAHVEETERIKRLVRENPRQAAMVLKSWIQQR